MTNKAMKKRHWDRISELIKHPIDIESDDLKLRNSMEGTLLKFKEEIEVFILRLCSSFFQSVVISILFIFK